MIAVRCIELLNKDLQENTYHPPLSDPICQTLSPGVSYACRFWIEHICEISLVTDNLGHQIYDFLGRHLLHWVEAMSILKCYRSSFRLLRQLLGWVKVRCLTTSRGMNNIVTQRSL